ncbi:MAG: amino acid racemase [Gemmatimonadaceae bacterium]|nr:amino acid racemase [Gemmatimonadaceae bacterium]
MPAIAPPGGAVDWSADELTIGVVGVAPWATIDFLSRVTRHTPATRDWHHLRVLVDSNPKIPSRGRCLELGETDPTPLIRATITELAAHGADIVVVPCNTAHLFHDGFAAGAACVVPDMVALAVRATATAAPTARRVAVLGSRATVRGGRYARALAARGMGQLDGSAWDEEIWAVIEEIKQGGHPDARVADLVARAESAGADAVILACTELSVVAPPLARVPVLDSNDILARWCVTRARAGSRADARRDAADACVGDGLTAAHAIAQT